MSHNTPVYFLAAFVVMVIYHLCYVVKATHRLEQAYKRVDEAIDQARNNKLSLDKAREQLIKSVAANAKQQQYIQQLKMTRMTSSDAELSMR